MKKEPNEKKIYERVMAEGFIRGNEPSFSELLALGKHIRQEKGYGEKNIIKWLVEFCEREDEFFNKVTSETLLEAVSREVIKNTAFRKINFPIRIVQDEVDAIRSVHNSKYQKLLLAALVVAKSSGNPELFSDSPKQIFHIIEVSGEKSSYTFFITELSDIANRHGIFKFVANKYQFYAFICGNSGDVAFEISDEDDYYNSSDIYRKFIGGDLMWCKECKKEEIKRSNRHIYCDECSKDKVRESKKELMRKRRKN